jgi:membrane-bound serine protease (ClpP class)
MTLVRLALDPAVSGILLGIGFAGLIVETLTLSLVAGAAGAVALGLFFALHLATGTLGVPLLVAAVQALAVAVVVAVALVVLAIRVVPERVFVRRLSLRDEPGLGEGAAPDYRALLGHSGFATSFLRPAGVAAIDGQRIDVLTEGEFVPAGTAVIVTRVEGARIFVRPEGKP